MTKQEAIKEAYGEKYESYKPWINQDGWCSNFEMWNRASTRPFKPQECETFKKSWRPKWLHGIENNNNWQVLTPEILASFEHGTPLAICSPNDRQYVVMSWDKAMEPSFSEDCQKIVVLYQVFYIPLPHYTPDVVFVDDLEVIESQVQSE